MVYNKGVKNTEEPISIKEYWYEGGKRKSKTLWDCPYYRKWTKILKRCYCPIFLQLYPTYKGTSVTKD